MSMDDWSLGGFLAAGAAVIAAGTIFVGGCGAICNNWEVSKGERTGMVNKVSRKGYFWKTYEGQMALEGISSSGDSVGANVWDFSIDNNMAHGENIDNLTSKLGQYTDSGTKVKIKYVEMAGTWPWRSGTDHLIQGVEPVAVKTDRNYEVPATKLEKELTTPDYKNQIGKETTLDGRTYLLRHDKEGKLRITELKEVQ